MSLQDIAFGAVAVINPPVLATIMQATGYTIDDDGSQVPSYATFNDVPVQMQALSNDEIHQVEGLNLQGNKQAVYLAGSDWSGLVRNAGKGGDLFVIGGDTWLVATVLENWPDWVKLALVQQTIPADGNLVVQSSDNDEIEWG